MFSHRSGPPGEAASGTSVDGIFHRKRGASRSDSPTKSSECTEVVSILTIDRLAFITNRTDTSVERSSASVGGQLQVFHFSASILGQRGVTALSGVRD